MVQGGRLWWAVNPRLVSLAPIYVFPDQDRFNGDEVDQLARQNLMGTLRLPHASCIFEVPERNHPGACLASYTLDSPTGIESGLFRFCPVERRWSDVLAQVSFLEDGSAETSAHQPPSGAAGKRSPEGGAAPRARGQLVRGSAPVPQLGNGLHAKSLRNLRRPGEMRSANRQRNARTVTGAIRLGSRNADAPHVRAGRPKWTQV